MSINKPNKINCKKNSRFCGKLPQIWENTRRNIEGSQKNQTCYSENNKLIIIATLSF